MVITWRAKYGHYPKFYLIGYKHCFDWEWYTCSAPFSIRINKLVAWWNKDVKLQHFECIFNYIFKFVISAILVPAGANNLIPIEIALKIANKIRANERFAAYIVIPMWPWIWACCCLFCACGRAVAVMHAVQVRAYCSGMVIRRVRATASRSTRAPMG